MNDERTPRDERWAELERLRALAAERYRKIVAETELNLAFLSGNQWTCWTAGEGITPVENATNEIRRVDNRLKPAYVRLMKELFGDEPAITAYEGGIEVKDSMAAKCAVQICDYLSENNGWADARVALGTWVMVTGTAYLMPYWKPNARHGVRPVRRYSEAPVRTRRGISHLFTEEVENYEGDIAFDVLNPLNTYCFPLSATSWNDVTAIMNVNLVTLDDLGRRLGADLSGEDLVPHNAGDVNFEALSRINRYVSPDFGYAADMAETERRYMEIQYWERPCARRPKGRYVHAYGGKIAHDGPLPYLGIARSIDPGDNYNLTMGIIPQFSEISGCILHTPAVVSNWRPAQTQLNDLLTRQAQNRDAVGNNKLIIQEGMLRDDQWTNESGQLIEVPAGMSVPPQYIQGQPLVGLEQELDRAEYSLQQNTGQSLAVQGRNDTQVRSAMHFEMLLNSADSVNWMLYFGCARNDRLTAKFVTAMVRRYWSEDRIIDAVGRDRANYYLAFRDAVLNMDIRFKRGSSMSRNHVIRMETLKEWLQYGLFSDAVPERTRRAFLRATELGYLFDVADDDAAHRNRAGYENLLMAIGQPVEPDETENHLVHIQVHDAWLQSPEGRASGEAVESVVRAHVRGHRILYSSQMAPQLDLPASPYRGAGDISLTSPSRLAAAPRGAQSQPAAQPAAPPTGAGGAE
jgi:hypothetical protein